MIFLLGSTGHIGQAFRNALKKRRENVRSLSRFEVDYTRFSPNDNFLKEQRVDMIINAADYTGKLNVDVFETAKADTLQGNTLFPQALSNAWAVALLSNCIMDSPKLQAAGIPCTRSTTHWRTRFKGAKPRNPSDHPNPQFYPS
jgi:hypothetical protein